MPQVGSALAVGALISVLVATGCGAGGCPDGESREHVPATGHYECWPADFERPEMGDPEPSDRPFAE